MVDSAATAIEADGASAPALTESYMRLREQVGNVLAGDLSDEFNATFPSIDLVQPPTSPQPHATAAWRVTAEPAARRARALLGQLAGWIDGLIEEQTLERRIRMEAEELAKRQRPGFTG